MTEFQPCHHTALHLAGTVSLPSPYPASGPVSVVVARDDGDLEVFVKILQVVGDKRIITRFIRPDDIRAVRGNPDGQPGGGLESWPILGIKKIKGKLDKLTKELLEKAEKTGILGEAVWYPSAIVYVPESAPVIHRDEAGVTAAVSAEEVWFGASRTCC
jgi:hypothetical protein